MHPEADRAVRQLPLPPSEPLLDYLASELNGRHPSANDNHHSAQSPHTATALTLRTNDKSWANNLRLPEYIDEHAIRPPAAGASPRWLPRDADERAPVLPSLFLPGFPKSATSWLTRCMQTTWSPPALGCGRGAANWTAARCKKRFLLMSLGSSSSGDIRHQKELFFFGGTNARFWDGDLLGLHGPDPRAPPFEDKPALWLWESQPPRRRRRGNKLFRDALDTDEATRRAGLMRRLATLCAAVEQPRACAAYLREVGSGANLTAAAAATDDADSLGGGAPGEGSSGGGAPARRQSVARRYCAAVHLGVPTARARKARCATDGISGMARYRLVPGPLRLNNSCVHPACQRIAYGEPKSWSSMCQWPKETEARNFDDAFCLKNMVPRPAEGELNLTMVDFTPNYMCDPAAISRIHQSATDPSAVRFIVLMRDPIMRAYSEWSMFAMGWNWDDDKHFGSSFGKKLRALRGCNRTLFDDPGAIARLSTRELRAYLGRCFRKGAAMMYPHTSMYSVCIAYALRIFKREQFLFLRYEDLMRMDGEAITRLVGRFTGLHVDDKLDVAGCSPRAGKSARRPMSFSEQSPETPFVLRQLAPALERFFAPYNRLLTELVHPAFRWRPEDHAKRLPNASAYSLARYKRDQEEHKKAERSARAKKSALEQKAKARQWAIKQRAGRVATRRLRMGHPAARWRDRDA